jgi:hypothetical protein
LKGNEHPGKRKGSKQMESHEQPSVINIELYECSQPVISVREYIQDYVIQLCKMIGIERMTDIHISDDSGEGYVFHQAAKSAYISGYFMPSTRGVNITIFTLKTIMEDRPIAIFSYDFFMAKTMDLNFLQRKII